MTHESASRIKRAISEISAGRPVLLLDDEARENEADFVISAELITPEWMNFLIRHGSGIVCLCLEDATVRKLALPMMVSVNHNHFGTAFTVSIEASHGVSTGVSAPDRVRTIKAAIADDATPRDVVSPGHMFPLRAHAGGVLARQGHTEGSIELMRFCGLKPAATICELMNLDGNMARLSDAQKFADKYNFAIVFLDDIIQHIRQQERLNEPQHHAHI